MAHETALTTRTIAALLLPETRSTAAVALFNAVTSLGYRAVMLPATTSAHSDRAVNIQSYVDTSTSLFYLTRRHAPGVWRNSAQRFSGGDPKLDTASVPSVIVVLDGQGSGKLAGAEEANVVSFDTLVDNGRPTRRLQSILGRSLQPSISGAMRKHRPSDVIPGAPHLKTLTIQSYNMIAGQFADVWVNHPPLAPLEKFRSLVPRSGLILDAGCGPGHHAAFLHAEGLSVLGIDISEGMIQIARKVAPKVSFELMDMEDLRFPAGVFDGIWCSASALHIPRERLSSVFRGFRRVLKDDGVIAVGMQIGRTSEIAHDHRFFEYLEDAATLRRLVSRAGFRIIETDMGATRRNTHSVDIALTWATVIGRAAGGSKAS